MEKAKWTFCTVQSHLLYCKAWDSSWVLDARILEWVAISSSGRPHFARTLHYDHQAGVALHDMAHSFIELHKPLHHDKTVVLEWEMVKDRGVCCAEVHRITKC